MHRTHWHRQLWISALEWNPKRERATFKFLKSMCFIKCENWSLVCSENGDFQKHLKKPIPVTTFEVYRFSLWFSKNSIRWSLPKKCITSLLILTFLKFREKRNIIHAHRNLISQFVPYEKSVRRCPSLKILQDAPKNGPRDFQIFEEYAFYQVRKMVTGLQRKWWFSKTLKKAYTSDNFWSLSFQSLVL